MLTLVSLLVHKRYKFQWNTTICYKKYYFGTRRRERVISHIKEYTCRYQQPRGLRRSPPEIVGSNPTGSMDVCCEGCVWPGRGLCDKLITRMEDTYRLWCVMSDLETSRMRRPRHALGRSATGKWIYLSGGKNNQRWKLRKQKLMIELNEGEQL
jgi:hypothetical protein